MGDSRLELPPSEPFPPVATPSGLTPNTRSEAEAALHRNSLVQTDSAAPLIEQLNTLPTLGAGGNNTLAEQSNDVDDAQQAYHGAHVRKSSTNYEKALNAWNKQASASSNFSNTSTEESASGENTAVPITGERPVASPTATIPFPAPGQGVVPLHTGVGSGQAEAVKKARPSGLSLGSLGRQQSWNEQDFKHVHSAQLMKRKEDGGYDSGVEGNAK